MPIGDIQPPAVHPDDEPLVCIQINEQWVSYLLGMVWPAKYPEYWSGTLEENRTARKDVMQLMEMISLASEDNCMPSKCCVPVQVTYKVDPETGMVVQTSDNGVTFEPQAGGLPSVIVEPIPPVTSGVSATKCDAATNVQGQVQTWITQVTNDFDTAVSLLTFASAVLEAILAAVLTILSAGTLTAVEALVLPLLGAALGAAWAAGKTVFVDYWTTNGTDDILCAAYCAIEEDGSFTDSGFTEFFNKCNEVLPPSPAKMLFLGFISSVGRQGLNAMAASGISADADCGDCTCVEGCVTANWHLGIWSGSAYGNAPTLVSQDDTHWRLTSIDRGDGQQYIYLTSSADNECCSFVATHVSGADPTAFVGIACGTDRVYTNLVPLGISPPNNLNSVGWGHTDTPFTLDIEILPP